MTQLERLVQEHAIYKQFFIDYRDRPLNGPNEPYMCVSDRIKILGFEVVERLNRLDRDIMYYDPSWAHADEFLFTTDINSLKADRSDAGSHVVEKAT